MASLPTPNPDDRRDIDFDLAAGSIGPSTGHATTTSSGTWRRSAAIATATSGLLIGAVAVSAQFAFADSPRLAASTTPTAPTVSADVDQPTDDDASPNEGESDGEGDAGLDAFEACIGERLAVDLDELEFDELDGPPFDVIAGGFEGLEPADGTCPPFDPEMAMPFSEEFAAFDECLAEQLGDDLFDLGAGPMVSDFRPGSPPNVVIDAGAGNGEAPGDLGLYEFGDGDGTITVTKTDGELAVAVDGDVTKFDFAKADAEWSAAHEACADLLPEGFEAMADAPSVGGPFEFSTETILAD